MLTRFVELVKKLQSTMGRLEKEAHLSEYRDDPGVRDVLYFLFNPYIVTGISDKKLDKAKRADDGLLGLLRDTEAGEGGRPNTLPELIEYFRRNPSGRDVDVATLHAFARGHDAFAAQVIYGLIKKDLKLGVQEKTLNKVFGPGFIPTMDVMLAESYDENIPFLEGKEFIVTLKLDGVRAVLINTDGKATFYSRGGRHIADLTELEAAALKLDPNYIYDGELLLAAPTPGSNVADTYRQTVKITSGDSEKRGLIFNVFDKVLKDDFMNGISVTGTRERKGDLAAELTKIGEPLIRAVPILYDGSDLGVIPSLLEEQVKKGEEGLMINPAHGPYECKRTKNLLKVKKFHTADVRVISLEEGGGANRGKLGAVYVAFLGPDNREYTCKVGSGFSQTERETFWANPDDIRGKIIEIGYFELSKNQNDNNYSLRFPTFKHLRPDKDAISMN